MPGTVRQILVYLPSFGFLGLGLLSRESVQISSRVLPSTVFREPSSQIGASHLGTQKEAPLEFETLAKFSANICKGDMLLIATSCSVRWEVIIRIVWVPCVWVWV